MSEIENTLSGIIKKSQLKQMVFMSSLGILIALLIAGTTYGILSVFDDDPTTPINDGIGDIYTGDIHLGVYISDHLDDIVRIEIASNTSGGYLSDTQVGVVINNVEDQWETSIRYCYWPDYPELECQTVKTTVPVEEVESFFITLLTAMNSSTMNNVTMDPEEGRQIMITSFLHIAFFVYFEDLTGFNFEWMTHPNGTEFLGAQSFSWYWNPSGDPDIPAYPSIESDPSIIKDGEGSFLEPLNNFQIFFDNLGLFFVKYNPYEGNT